MAYNGMGANGKILNAHLSYKGRSVIIDYEFCLRAYSHLKEENDNKDRNKFVPFEVFPYGGDIYVGYVEVDEGFHKADLGKLIEELDKIIAEEPEPYVFSAEFS